jgi:hypothetical protein
MQCHIIASVSEAPTEILLGIELIKHLNKLFSLKKRKNRLFFQCSQKAPATFKNLTLGCAYHSYVEESTVYQSLYGTAKLYHC